MSPLLFVLILATTTFASAASDPKIYASENPLPVGSTVTLFSQENVTTGAWLFDNDIIVIIFPGDQIIGDSWRARVTFNSTSSALTIRSLQLEDSGVYTLQAVNSFRAQLTLSVQVPVSGVTLTANTTNLVEFNDTAVLMCSALSGSSLSYAWLKGSSEVTAGGGIQLSDGGTTLTLVSVTRDDVGPFRCNVSNGLSHEISPPVSLNISYGPSNITMTIMPMKSAYRTGSDITLWCSAESSPPAVIQWMVNGTSLNHFGPMLQLERVTESNSGNYRCLLHNTVTSRFSSKSATIRIVEPIAAAVVKHTGGPAILNEPFSLHCEVTGFVTSIHWWKNGQLIQPDNATNFHMDNKTLILDPVQLSDDGDYRCQAVNPVSNMTSSPYTVQVNYGPQMPTITGPNVAKTGHNVTFSCHASSNPPSSYKWFYNGSVVASMSEYITPPLTKDMSGMYTCKAYNNITGENSTAYTMLTVFDPIDYVEVEPPMNPAIEGHVYKLTCNVSGPVVHIYWMKNGELLHEDHRTVFHMDNKTVTFNPLEKNDAGYYQCMAIIDACNVTSPSYMLLVNFGPETPMIRGPAFAEMGHYATFYCSATSEPPSYFSWWFDGNNVGNNSTYTTDRLSFNMSGEYTCKAHNNVTGKNSSSSKMLTVIEAIESVMIKNKTIPINNKNFTLTCDVTGPYDAIHWMKDGVYLNMNNSTADAHMSYYFENETLYFTPVTIYDDGMYQCVATNQAGRHKSPKYTVWVNYGPLHVTISGPFLREGSNNSILICSADSRPVCDFYWFFNNQPSVVLMTGPMITFPTTKGNEGTYICMARNPVTNITMYKTKTFSAAASALHFTSRGVLMLMGVFALSVPVLSN
ncbi:carcinoembryonic antigen-related cell adhesion molecule 5-like [Plectropomus leopardus]|uniref:carcinoembryonic antigen-related cell adhesion molecule 5-like n=1 Tax=Plectropomus leopardus TaxID=160734 RepID=UPI001C4B5A39|nr:carcinoembryonic antigen-related cell adhesion molecule 5-like [Plectropomus leopardus]